MSTCASDVKFLREGQPRRYTLTHNDLTAQLHLAIGEDFNTSQISGWYSRLVRDEVCAEWCFSGGPALHLHCHVSGAVSWFAPARFRSYIFSREMPLVLDSIVFAERHLFACRHLRQAPVFVHFEAVESDLARVEYWGTLGQWIEREDGPAEDHLARVSRTMRDAQPAIPRSARLDGPLESLLELLTDGLVERPRPGGGVKAARSIVNDAQAGTSGACVVCGEGGEADGAAVQRAQRVAEPECDCEGCKEAEGRADGRKGRSRLQGAVCAQAGSPAAEAHLRSALAGGGSDSAARALPPQRHVVVAADSSSAGEGCSAGSTGRMGRNGRSRRNAFSTIDLEDGSSSSTAGRSMRGRSQYEGGGGDRERALRSLERAVDAAAGPRAESPQRRRTQSHYVAPPPPATLPVEVRVVKVGPAVQGARLKVGGPVETGSPSLQAELARRSRAAVAELRQKSRSRTPNGGRRRVSV